MLFNSYIFFIFFILVIPTYYFLPRRARTWFLLAASYFFYGYWDWRFLSLIAFSTVVDYCVGLAIGRAQTRELKKKYLLVSLVSNLTILGFFKYFNFFVDSFYQLCQLFNVKLDSVHLNILLPVGISFYTFQALSYTIDIYRGKLEPSKNFWDFALFVAFFPQLVAGPIERAVHLLPQVQKMPTPVKKDFRDGFALITIGMFKKVMIGDTCGRIVDQIFAQPSLYASMELLMALMLFSVQIYVDFSGYSSIAKGVAKFMGIHIMENFSQPYLSSNITEFWRRWHISLSSWLKDYLYISIGGNRKGTKRTYLNLMITMLLGGLWHGANWTFVFWGGLHGFYLAAHKFILRGRKPAVEFVYTNIRSLGVFIVKVCCTNVLVLFTWLFFRADTFQNAFFILKKFILWQPSEFSFRIIGIVTVYVGITLFLDVVEYFTRDAAFILRIKSPYLIGGYAAVWVVILLYLYQAAPMPFIYFQF